MKFKQAKQVTIAAIALALILVIGGSFAASLEQQKNFRFTLSPQGQSLQISSFSGFQAVTIEKTTLLALPTIFSTNTPMVGQLPAVNSTRLQIFDYINANPGVQFRAICAGLTIPVGLAQYHLGVLVKSGLVSFVRDGKYKRFFVAKKFTQKQVAAITMLRHKTAKRIIEVLLAKKQVSHSKLADEVRISSQALTWQMKNLKNTDFVLQVNDGLKTIYSIDASAQPLLETSLTYVN